MKVYIFIFIVFTIMITSRTIYSDDNWTYYLNGNDIHAVAIRGDDIWCAATGGMIRWNRIDMTYEQFYPASGCCGYQLNEFTSVAIGNNGVVWCSNGDQLYRYDGTVWTMYDSHNSGLPGTVTSLLIDNDNVLVMSTSLGAALFDGLSWKIYTQDSEDNSFEDVMAVDNNNVKWFGTEAGAACFDGSDWMSYTPENGLPDKNVTAVAAGSGDETWFAFRNGTIASFDGTSWTVHDDSPWVIRTLTVDKNNTVWGGSLNGLHKGDWNNNDIVWTHYTEENSVLPDDSVLYTVLDENGVVWLSTRFSEGNETRGLTRFDGTSWETWNIDGPLSYRIKSVAVDQDNIKWFGTSSGGVTSFDGTTWTTYTVADGLASDNIGIIAVDNENVKWFTGGGITRFDGETWTIYTTENSGLKSTYARSIAVDRDNVKWFDTPEGMTVFDGTDWTTYTEDDKGNVLTGPVTIDKDNVKWIGTPDGVSSFDGTVWKHYEINGLGTNNRKFAVDNNNVKWFMAHNSGVFGFDGITLKHYFSLTKDDDPAFPEHGVGPVVDLAVDTNGKMWFMALEGGMAGAGLLYFDDTTWKYYYDDFWLSYAAKAIAVDHDNVIWIGTHSGIARYDFDPGDGESAEVSDTNILPYILRLHANYPNPFNSATTISFTLPEKGYTTLAIYNLTGQKIHELLSGFLSTGTHHFIWNGCDDNCIPVSTGIYISKVTMGNKTAANRMVVLR